MTRLLRFLVPAGGLISLAVLPVAAQAAGSGGVTGPAIFVDGNVYRTVGTPTDFSATGAPADSFNTIYDFGGLQFNVADSAPGMPDYHGGRWMVHGLSFQSYSGAISDPSVDLNGNGVLDSQAEVMAAIAKGYATDLGVVKSFECPVIPINS